MIGHRARSEVGSALIIALLSTMIMLGLGLALLSIVDTQASQSDEERTRDRAFNLTESVLTSEAFVLGRSWPDSTPAGDPACSTTGFGDPLGAAPGSTPPSERLRANLNATYNPTNDTAYSGATWRANVCDDVEGETVWDDTILDGPDGTGPLLGAKSYDANHNNKVWVRAESTVRGHKRAVAGLVRVRSTPALDQRYALVSGGLADDLGSTLNTITNQGVLGGVLSGLLGTTPTVAGDPTIGAPTPNGITGLRCGALDIKDGSTCVTGTIGALGAIPLVSTLVTGGKVENFPSTTSATEDSIARLRAQARARGTYTAVSAGTTPVASSTPLNPTDTAPASIAACTLTGSPGPDSVVFIEKVGNSGAANTAGGPGDQYCSVDVSTARQYRAIVIGSGRVVIRGNNNPTVASNTSVNTFKGVVYALNLQRQFLPLADAPAPGREVLRVDRGAHVRGGVMADGKSAKIGIYPPPITIDNNALIDSLVPCIIVAGLQVCTVRNLVKALTGGLTAIVDKLLTLTSLNNVVGAILDQANGQRANYGSAITADVAAINNLTVYGASGVVPGTFRDLQPR